MSRINFDQIRAQLEPQFLAAIDGLLEGSASDLAGFVTDILADMAQVATITDNDRRAAVLAELHGQLKMVAEKNRLRFNNESWAQAERVLKVVTSTLATVLVAAI